MLCLFLANGLFSSILLSCLKVNYPVKLENDFCEFLVIMYMWPNFKPPNKCMYSSYQNMWFYSELNPPWKNKPRQEVEDSYIFCKYFVKIQSDY